MPRMDVYIVDHLEADTSELLAEVRQQFDGMNATLARMAARIDALNATVASYIEADREGDDTMSQALDNLTRAVSENPALEAAINELGAKVTAEIARLGADQTKLQTLADELDASQDRIAAAILAHTPVDPAAVAAAAAAAQAAADQAEVDRINAEAAAAQAQADAAAAEAAAQAQAAADAAAGTP